MATVDADTLLMPDSLRAHRNPAAGLPARHGGSRRCGLRAQLPQNFITRAQEWDYFLGIASVKRQQGLFQGTMVAQGAFSVYRTAALKGVGGWPDRIGEDIVLTWAMLRGRPGRLRAHRDRLHRRARRRQGFRPPAPPLGAGDDRGAARARRGLLAGALQHPRCPRQLRLPLHRLVYSIAFILGVVLAFTGNFAIVGPMTLAVLPLNLLLGSVMYFHQRHVFQSVNLRVRKNKCGSPFYFSATSS